MQTESAVPEKSHPCKVLRAWFPLLAFCWVLPAMSCFAQDGTQLAPVYAAEVDRKLNLPDAEQRFYAQTLSKLLAEKNIDAAQYLVLVDRNEFVQAAMIYWMSTEREFYFIGASPVSTGKPGRFDHFTTPVGVFVHTIDNPDFRAEGTRNELGIRGYGRQGMRIFDFGWQQATKGWGKGGDGTMRLQMHATDPDILESRVGTAQSKGCIRIPASLNVFIDHHGILDADYDQALASGQDLWVLSKNRQPTPWSGRFLIVVDTERTARPEWSGLPRPAVKTKAASKPFKPE